MTDRDLDVLVYVSRMLREIDSRVRAGYAGDQDPEIAAIFMAVSYTHLTLPTILRV